MNKKEFADHGGDHSDDQSEGQKRFFIPLNKKTEFIELPENNFFRSPLIRIIKPITHQEKQDRFSLILLIITFFVSAAIAVMLIYKHMSERQNTQRVSESVGSNVNPMPKVSDDSPISMDSQNEALDKIIMQIKQSRHNKSNNITTLTNNQPQQN